MIKAKKILIILLGLFFTFVLCNLKVDAYYMLPVGDGIYEYSSINSVPALLGDFGGGTKIQQTKIEELSSITSDRYVIVYKANKKANIPYYQFEKELRNLNTSAPGTTVTCSSTFETFHSETYEMAMHGELSVQFTNGIEALVGVEVLNLGKYIETSIEASLAGEVRRSTTTNIHTSQTISVSTVIPAPGWYNLQARALYDTYMIIEVSEVYDVYANQKGVLVRNDDMPTRTFVLDRHVRFAYYGYNETGLYKYNYNSNNDTYVIDDSYMPNANDVVYL